MSGSKTALARQSLRYSGAKRVFRVFLGRCGYLQQMIL